MLFTPGRAENEPRVRKTRQSSAEGETEDKLSKQFSEHEINICQIYVLIH